MMHLDFYRKTLALIIVFISVVSSSCATLKSLGSTPAKKGYPSYSNEPLRIPSVSQYIDQISSRLLDQVPAGEKSGGKLDVTVLKTSRIQGWSMYADRQIAVTRGMLNIMVNEAELACLIGHEIGHAVQHGRGKSSYKREQEDRLFKDKLGDIFLTDEMRLAKWSQKKEEEADEYGSKLCGKAGYDAYALVNFFDRLSQFQEKGFFASLNELTATHKNFQSRSKYLKKHLEGSGIRPGEGKLNEREYEKALASLKGVHTDDVVNEVLPGGAAVAEQMLDAIMSELKEYERSGKNLPVERFIDIMEGLREIALRYGIDMSSVRMADLAYSPASAYRVFMKEVLSQDTPVWGANAGGRFKSVLLNLGRIGVGFIPVVGDAVDLYEFLSGKDFLTGTQLTFGERVLTAAGLLAGSGKIWREVAGGIGETLDSAKLAKRVGKGSVNQSRKALNEAENLTGSVLKENGQVGSRRITVLGSRQDTLVARDWPRHNVLNLPEGKWSWAKNKQWLDDAIERGDEFYLATDPNKWRQIRPSSVYFDELEYLKSQEFIQEGNRMIRKKVTIQAPN